MSLIIEPLDTQVHIRAEFMNQHRSLQNYIQSIARQDMDKDLARCFVLVGDDKVIKGYYTLNNLSIPSSHWDIAFKKKYKLTYQAIPCTLIGRLALDSSMQGKRLGEILLFDSLRRAYDVSRTIASFAVVVDCIDLRAKQFYEKYEFHELMDTNRLFIPMKTVHNLIN